MTKYNLATEQKMCLYFSQLREKDKRHYAAIEAMKLGHGGIKYISDLFKISEFRIRTGIKELDNPELLACIPKGKQRRTGGGRKKKEISKPALMEGLKLFIHEHKAGSPTNPDIFWIHLRPKEIALQFESQSGHKVSHGLVKRVLLSQGYKYRKMSKTLATGHYEDRDKQFEIIFKLVAIMSVSTPIISIDCKKKERLGNLYRDGSVFSTGSIEVYDHDYHYLAQGAVIPHGIYDVHKNEGYISIGNSHETAEFIADNLLWWWDNYGVHTYPDTKCVLVLCDAGGGNSYRHHAFKKHIQRLAKQIGIDFIICHYPPYASKWNPIEHRLFCHAHKAIQGVVFSDYDIVKELFSKTSTDKGLKVFVRLNLKAYPTGIKTHKSEIDFDKIQFNQNIPSLSYRIAA